MEDILLKKPEKVITDYEMFLCTYAASLNNLHFSYREFIDRICEELEFPVIAVNSNFGNKALEGYEKYIKTESKKKPKHKNKLTKERKRPGTGTAFGSGIELVIIDNDRPFKAMCFPQNGGVHINGSIMRDFSDAKSVLSVFIKFLNDHQMYDDTEDMMQISVNKEGPSMIDVKFNVIRISERIIINLEKLCHYIRLTPCHYELSRANVITASSTKLEVAYIIPDIKTIPIIRIFPKGKINILGAKSYEYISIVHAQISNIISTYWDEIVSLIPTPDSDEDEPDYNSEIYDSIIKNFCNI